MYKSCCQQVQDCALSSRETREGWPLLTVETEVNGYSWRTYKMVLPWLVGWAQCSALAIFFLTAHYFTSFVPVAQQAGQAVMTRRLSLNMCLCFLSSLCPACIAKTQYRKFQTNIPRKGTARLQSQFPHSCFLSHLYIPLIVLPILLQENRWTERGII